MSQPSPQINLSANKAEILPGLKRFSHSAMAATFEVIILHDDNDYARQAAGAAFNELDRIENELSRYVENSDISRINNAKAGEPVVIGLDTFECLEVCRQMYIETDGAFDVTVGTLMDCWFDEDKKLRQPSAAELKEAMGRTGFDLVILDKENYTVQLKADGLKLDLGGIGKGYGVDKMAELLKDWGIKRALVHGGASSIIAIGSPKGKKGWPLTLSNPVNAGQILAKFYLRDKAVSASGLQKGGHIIDPRTGRTVKGNLAAWASADTAAVCDALSTAFMILSPEEIERYSRKQPNVSALIILEHKTAQIPNDKLLKFGSLW